MDAVKREQWEAAGIDVESALGRFMGNEMLLERFMKKFLEDSNFENLRKALAAKDLDAAISASHTLKGLCGNLSMTVLFDLFTKQVAVLRARANPTFGICFRFSPFIPQRVQTSADTCNGFIPFNFSISFSAAYDSREIPRGCRQDCFIAGTIFAKCDGRNFPQDGAFFQGRGGGETLSLFFTGFFCAVAPFGASQRKRSQTSL